jgi:hypothetical protein
VLLVHTCRELHWVQAAPPLPHAVCPVPGWHAPVVSQQPVQVVGEQATATQAWLWHCSVVLHWTQVAPAFPQSAALVPGMHVPL